MSMELWAETNALDQHLFVPVEVELIFNDNDIGLYLTKFRRCTNTF